jgi:alanine racemase
MSILIQNIVPILKARAVGNTAEAVIDAVSIDSRSLQNSILYSHWFKIMTHSYIKDLIATGCKTLLFCIQKDADKLIFLL